MGFWRRSLLGIFTLIYVSALLVYSNPHNTYIANYINIGLLVLFLLDTLLDKEIIIYHNVFTDGFAIFVLLSAISIIWSANSSRSVEFVTSMAQMAINNYLIYNLLKKYHIQTFFVWGFITALSLNYLHGFGIIHLDVQTNQNWRFEGTAGNSNEMGIYIFMGVVLCFLAIPRKLLKFQLILLPFLPFSLYFAILTGSRKTLIAIVLFSLFYLVLNLSKLLKPKTLLYLALLSLVVITQIDFNKIMADDTLSRNIDRLQSLSTVAESGFADESVRERRELIEWGLKKIPEKPIFGFGIGTFIDVTSLKHYSHNNYIELLFGVGLVGFLASYFGPVAILLRSIRKRHLDIALIIVIILILDVSVVSYNLKPHMLFYIFLASLLDLHGKN